MDVTEYLDVAGRSPFAKWADGLDSVTRVRITTQLARLEQGNLTSLKSVGNGVLELRMDFGPGYRIYLGRQEQELIILLCGGSKAQQQKDIKQAKAYWHDYKQRRR